MVFKQTSKEKEEKLVINIVGGSLPIVKYPKYLIITCLKREGEKKRTWNVQEAERPERLEQTGGIEKR